MCPGSATSNQPYNWPTGERVLVSCATLLVFALAPSTSGFALQVLDLAHTWSDRSEDDIDLSDIRLLSSCSLSWISTVAAATVPPRASRTAHCSCTTSHQHQPHDVPALCTARTVQLVTRAELHILEILVFELATLTPAAWVEIFRRRLSLWQRQLLQPPDLLTSRLRCLLVVRITMPKSLSSASPFNSGSTASQVGATAWFVSTVLWILLGTIAVQ